MLLIICYMSCEGTIERLILQTYVIVIRIKSVSQNILYYTVLYLHSKLFAVYGVTARTYWSNSLKILLKVKQLI
jgi:hypothetical protein